jgi:hypothetical protein
MPLKRLISLIRVSALLCLFSLAMMPSTFARAAKPADSPLVGVFEGITPCTNATNRPVLQISADTECEMMIWHLTLEQDIETGAPTTFALDSSYGMSQPNTTGIRADGIPLQLAGSWTILQGTATDPDATVYQLNPDNGQASISFVRLDDDHLHVLTQDLHMAVGNGGWSYTLNRTDRPPTPLDPAAVLDAASDAPITTTGNGSDLLGVFDGRTPCADIVYQFTKTAPSSTCIKIKWRLWLYHDPETGAPTTYWFGAREPVREGTWTIARGSAADPDALVYQLAMDDTGGNLNLLAADENHLLILDDGLRLMLGDKLWSYTFSRVEPPS